MPLAGLMPCNCMQLQGINPASGMFEVQGQTDYFYDETPVSPTPANVPNKSAPVDSRANLSRVVRYKDPWNSVTETFEYDDLGNMISHRDPMLHPTNISYMDNFTTPAPNPTYAFPTQETNPQGHNRQTRYDYNTGLAKRTISPRGLNTDYNYDFMNRLESVTEPNGRMISYVYDDFTPKVTEQVQVDAGSTITTETWMDKFYRTTKTVQLDPAGDVKVDTVYDNDGRVEQVSEPYRTGSPVWT